MDIFRIYSFSLESGEKEFVIISDLPENEVLAEYATNGHSLDIMIEIDGDATGLPCDRELRHSLS